jgi:copper transport protein
VRRLRLWIGAALLSAASWAAAHASLVQQTPADSTVLEAAPAEVSLRFNEPVAPLVFHLTTPDGETRAIEKVTSETDEVRVPLPQSNARGTYWLSWRVVSADGHPVGGSLTWSVLSRTESPVASAGDADRTNGLTAAIWLSRLGLYVALIASVGTALFRAFFAGDGSRRTHPDGFFVLGLVSLVAAVGALGIDATSSSWSALRTTQPWEVALSTSYGLSAWLMLASLVASQISQLTLAFAARAAALAALALVSVSFAASGHASSAPPFWLARPAVFAHIAAVAFWVGSLLPLGGTLGDADGRMASSALRRFSRFIPFVLLVLVASGAMLAFLQLDRFDALWQTDYGRLLSVKLLLVIALLGVAAINRYALTRRVEKGDLGGRRFMRRLIGVEAALALAIFAVVATWRFTPPPRSIDAVAARAIQASISTATSASASMPSAAMPIHLHVHGDDAMADVIVKTLADHRVSVQMSVIAMHPTVHDAKEVSLRLARADSSLEPLVRPALRQPDGSWLVEPFSLPMAGRWQLRIDVLASDFDRVTLDQDVEITF